MQLRTIFCCCVAMVLVCQVKAVSAQTADRPNVIYIMADDMGYGDASTYNTSQSAVNTPHIDALAANGMKFTNAHSSSAVCSPTRYALMTGRHPYRDNKHRRVQTRYGDVWIGSGKRTVGNLMQDNGYKTGYVGKWHLGYNVYNSNGQRMTGGASTSSTQPDWTRGITDGPHDRGFDYAFGHVASADIPPYKNFENNQWVNTESVWVTGAGQFGTDYMRSGWADPDWDPFQITRVLRDKAVQFVNDNAPSDQPFFLYVPLSAPHTPTSPHPDFQGTTPHLYTDYVAEVDDVLGQVVAALEAKGELENTLIIFTSDNGANKGRGNKPDHRATGVIDGVNLRGQKADAWEGGHRVPFVVRWGDGTEVGSKIQPGLVNGEILDQVDLFRTMAGLVGDETVANTEAVDSWNMMPAFLGDGSVQGIHKGQTSTGYGGALAFRMLDKDGVEWKLIFSDGSSGWTKPKGTVVNPRNTITDFSALQLYNMTDDVGEQNNLLADGGTMEMQNKVLFMQDILQHYMTSGASIFGFPTEAADLDNDGDLDLDDWLILRPVFYTDLSGFSQAERLAMGDFNTDGLIDEMDFGYFKQAYDGANGPGSFEGLMDSVPEPATLMMIGAGMGLLLKRKRTS